MNNKDIRSIEIEGREKITLQKYVHFTVRGFKDYLNSYCLDRLPLHIEKDIFTTNDIYQYIIRGNLPEYFGDVKVKKFYYKEFGLKVLEIDWGKNVRYKKDS